MSILTRSWTARIAAAGLALSGSCLARQPEAPKPFKSGTVMVIEHASLAKLLTDPKDQALGNALAMIPARVRELPGEVPDMPPEAASLINMVLATFGRPGRLAVVYNGDNPSGGGFGYGAVFSTLTAGKEEADQMQAQITALMAMSKGGPRPVPSQRFKGMTDIQTPAALVSFGPRQANDGWRYEVMIGTIDNPDAVTEPLPAPITGLDSILRARVNLAGLTPALDLARAFGGNNPQAEEALEKIEAAGMAGNGALQISYQAGRTQTDSVTVTVMEGAKRFAPTLGLGTVPLTTADFASIPADATEVYFRRGGDAARIDLAALSQNNPQVQEGLDEFEAHTGVNLQTDVLDAIGTTFALYMSESTGGAGVGSAVAMVELRDRAKLSTAMTKLIATANMAADHLPMGPGHLKVVSARDGGTEFITLRFPGLPIPAEVTVALTERWLILSPTPQGTLVAARQASGKGDAGIMSNKLFAASIPGDKQVTGFSFIDAPRNLAAGYTLMTMIGSAIANGVRSPTDPSREPGMLVPVYNDLRKDARAASSFSYWRGDDLVLEAHADRSMIVNFTAAVGVLAKFVPLAAIPAAAGADQRYGAMNAPEAAFAAIASRVITPFTPEHAAWTLATSNPAAGQWVRWEEWMLRASAPTP
jgi:hypothetical protein